VRTAIGGLRIWVDECVTFEVESAAPVRGIASTSNRSRGMLGAPDRSVYQAALAEGFVVVTENHDDYLALACAEEVHPGLILLASPGGPLQLAAFHAAVDHIEREAAAGAAGAGAACCAPKWEMDCLFDWPWYRLLTGADS
jgi:hypothetical protein